LSDVYFVIYESKMVNFSHKPVKAYIQSALAVLVLCSFLLPQSAWAADCDRALGAPAIPACRQALQADPQDVDTLVEFADILLDLGRPDEAVDLLEASHGESPTNSSVRLKLSNAREAMVESGEDTGPSSRATDQLSVLRCKTRTGQAALDICNTALENQPHDVDLLVAKGDALMLLERPAEAVQTYDLALAQDASNTTIQAKLKFAEENAEAIATESAAENDEAIVAENVETIVPENVDETPLEDIKQIVKYSNAPINGLVSY
jgi:tetratricopeptide (TPR) repeat protein